MSSALKTLLIVTFPTLFVSCSSFEGDWQERGRVAVVPGSFDGRWSGKWTSARNGHTGGLRGIFSRVDDDRYEIRFHATYDLLALPLSYEYTLPVEVETDGDTYRFLGSADLGFFAGGVYEYNGSCAGDVFTSTYKASVDHGSFEMTRVPAGAP